MSPRPEEVDRSDLSLLEPRHVDALTTAIRALNTTISKAEATRAGEEKVRRAHEARQTAALEKIAAHTENLPALMSALARSSNGHGAVDQDADVPG